MPLLVTSAFGVNGDGYGALLAFDRNGAPLGVFCNDPRIADPPGLAVHQHEGLLYLNSGQNRVLAFEDEVIAFDFGYGECLGITVHFPRLHGQALVFFPLGMHRFHSTEE